jgi:hypothetical protein
MQSVHLFGALFFYKNGELSANEEGPQDTAFRHAGKEKHNFFVHLFRHDVRMFGSYLDIDSFLLQYIQVPEVEKFGFYELIRKDCERCHYFDIEWIDQAREDNPLLTVQLIKDTFLEFVRGRQAVETPALFDQNVVVMDSSRSIQGGMKYKHSYHLVYSHVYVENQKTQYAIMQSFKDSIIDMGELWFMEDGSPKCKIDFAVYSRNRCMRIVGSAKEPGERVLSQDMHFTMRLHFISREVSLGPMSLELVRVESDSDRPSKRRRTHTLSALETESDVGLGRVTSLFAAKRDFLRDVLRRSWGLRQVQFEQAVYHEFNDTFVVKLAHSADICPIHKRCHERQNQFVYYMPGKGDVTYHCHASELDTRLYYLRVSCRVPLFDDMEPVPFHEVYTLPGMRPYLFRVAMGSIMAAQQAPPIEPYFVHTLLIQGQMGIGKTKELYRFIRDLPVEKTVIFITYRISLADKYANDLRDFGFMHYRRDPFRLRDTKYAVRIVTCLDSICRFEGKYDFVVMDEIDSVLMHTGSPFMKMREQTLISFGKVVGNGENFIGLDANISRMVYALIERLRGPEINIRCVKNEYQLPCTRVAYIVSEVFTSAIVEHLKAGSRVAVCSMTRAYTEELSGFVRLQLPKCSVVVINSVRSSLYMVPDLDDGISRSPEISKPAIDLDEEVSVETPIMRSDIKTWEKADLLIYSPSIAAGVSFEHKDHFDILFIYVHVSNFTPLVDDLLQMMNRVRSFAKNEVYIYFAKRDLSVTTPDAIPVLPRNAQEVCNKFNEHDSSFFVRLMNGVVPPIDDNGIYVMQNWRTMLYCGIVMRRIASNCYFETVLFDRLRDTGYEIINTESASKLNAAQRKEEATKTFTALAELKAQRLREEVEKEQLAMAALRELLQKHDPELSATIDDAVLYRLVKTPLRLRNLPMLTSVLETLDFDAWLEEHNQELVAKIRGKETIGGKHMTMDGHGPRLGWLVRFMHETWGETDGGKRVFRQDIHEPSQRLSFSVQGVFYKKINEYVAAHPIPKSGTKRVLNHEPNPTGDGTGSTTAVRKVRTYLEEMGVDFYVDPASTKAPIVGFGDWQKLRPMVDKPALFEEMIYQLFRKRIDDTAVQKIKEVRLLDALARAFLTRQTGQACGND